MGERESHLGESDTPIYNLHEHVYAPTPLTISEICKLERQPWMWVVRRIAPFKESLELPEDLARLRNLVVPAGIIERLHSVTYTNTPAEDWMTTTSLAKELEVEYKWVNRRILYLKSPCEFRLHTENRPLLHFPPEALEELQEMRDQALENIDRGKYVHLGELSALTGRHRLWVSNRLDLMDVEIKLGYDSSGRMVEYYPVEILGYLREEKERYEDSGDNLSIPMLARAVDKDREWIERQLEEMEVEGELRHFEKSGRIDICFDPQVLIELIARVKAYVNPEADWFTENALVEITEKSSNWVRRRLKEFDIAGGNRQDSNGVLSKHYPPSVLEKLMEMREGWTSRNALRDNLGDKRLAEDRSDKFIKIFKLIGTTISRNGLIELGATEADIDYWKTLGLITRWGNKMYYFTKKAELLVQRVGIVEQQIENLRTLRDWLEE